MATEWSQKAPTTLADKLGDETLVEESKSNQHDSMGNELCYRSVELQRAGRSKEHVGDQEDLESEERIMSVDCAESQVRDESNLEAKHLAKTDNDLEEVPGDEIVDHRSSTHTDSMVTIRLSAHDNPLPPEKKPSALYLQTVLLPQDSSQDDDKKSRLEDIDSTIRVQPETTSAASRRSSTDSASTQHSVLDDMDTKLERCPVRIRSNSSRSISSQESTMVDWDKLDRNEQLEQLDDGADESTAFLLARLEQENNALAIDPKANVVKPAARMRSRTRPPSMQQLRKLINEPIKPSLRYSLLPSPPPMTELEFWSALVSNYPHTAQRLPTLTSNKIRNGVPPPLRGVVWMSIAGARDPFLEDEYERLCGESSPYEKLIGKDIGRSFPGVDMFRDADGDGQRMLGKVLNAFSLWDQEIGYCQGLGFVVGPLLMHMGDKDAFCVLVRLMEHYDLRSCFLPNLGGLHLRIYQFQKLLTQHLPELAAHLDELRLEPVYLSQWFLSFFGVTCPLPMLLRIYDVILTEGASETLMRVALSLMRRNMDKIMATTEFEDIMGLLLSRSLWDTYGCDADDLVADFCGLTGQVTREGLQALETSFKDSQNEGLTSPTISKPGVHSAASRFLGKFWAGSSPNPKATTISPSLAAPARPVSYLRRTPSKQSMASTLNSVEGSESNLSATSTDATNVSRHPSADWIPVKQTLSIVGTSTTTRMAPNKDRDLHSQIEDLLTALSDMQREQSVLANELQREREERDDDRAVIQRVIEKMKKTTALAAIPEDGSNQSEGEATTPESTDGMTELEEHFTLISTRRSSLIVQTKQQLREEVARWKEQHREEAARTAALSQQLTDQERETNQVKDELREARARVQEAHKDLQRREQTQKDARKRKSMAVIELRPDLPSVTGSDYVSSPHGLREFKLGRTSSSLSQHSPALLPPHPPPHQAPPPPTFSKRLSSLSAQSVPVGDDVRPPAEEALLLELVTAKTAEAVARQDLEEVKGKLDALRKLLGTELPKTACLSSDRVTAAAAAGAGAAKVALAPRSESMRGVAGVGHSGAGGGGAGSGTATATATAVGGGSGAAAGFFSGWGRRTASTSG